MARNTIQNYKRYTAGLKAQIEAERALPAADQLKTKDVFINGLPGKLAVHRIDSGKADLRALGRWLWSNPLRALGHRIHFEAHRQLLKDKSMPVQDGDIADFTLMPTIPYVDRITVDKRIGDILRKVFQQLRQRNANADMSTRVFTRLVDLFAE